MGRRREKAMVPEAELRSYYGEPVINTPVWKTPDVPAYLFLGGLAAGSSLLGAGAHATGRTTLAARSKVVAVAGAALSGVALVHDLGRPARFLNMLRTVKLRSPMSVGSWLLAGYSAQAGVAALSALTGRAPRTGAAATAGSAVLAPAIASYTAVLLADTAVPAWHGAHRELPFVFVGSGSAAAGGFALLHAGDGSEAPARRFASTGWVLDVVAVERMRRRMGALAEPYDEGVAGRWMKAGKVLGALGVAGANLGRRHRAARAVAGASLLAGSLCTRYGVFHAGMQSARDPAHTVGPQRERVATTSGAGS
jgi:hypothetical protein